MQVADETFQTWRKSKPEMRADILFRAAAIVRRRKHEFSAILVKEAGKPWNEADADTKRSNRLYGILWSSNVKIKRRYSSRKPSN